MVSSTAVVSSTGSALVVAPALEDVFVMIWEQVVEALTTSEDALSVGILMPTAWLHHVEASPLLRKCVPAQPLSHSLPPDHAVVSHMQDRQRWRRATINGTARQVGATLGWRWW